MNTVHTDCSQCVSCGKCTKNCAFLQKYNLDFSDREKLIEVAYHCFLCGTCSNICPIGIDGKHVFIELRKELVQSKKADLKKYAFLRLEKENYIFKNLASANKKRVLFLSCNFPSLYPQTSKKLIEIAAKHDIGVWFDCCAKPIGELGLHEKESAIHQRLTEHAKQKQIEEIIAVCPNCYYYLKQNTELNVVSIYEALNTLNIGNKIKEQNIHIFMPCPDRKENFLLESIKPFLPKGTSVLSEPQCCGLGGLASAKEPEISTQFSNHFAESLEKDTEQNMYVYCASCARQFSKNKPKQVKHILCEILAIDEQADIKNSFFNRLRFKFYKG